MKIQIKSRFNGNLIFETDAESLGAAVLAAIAAKANLSGANLFGADLSGADLSGANLFGADLSGANLFGANLSGANLSRANLSRANLSRADLSRANLSRADLSGANLSRADLYEIKISQEKLKAILATRTILPDGNLVGWKKLSGGVICKLEIPAAARRVGGLIGRKCRAEYATVLEGSGTSGRGGLYTAGKEVRPDSFDPDPLVECSHGIHFFITRQEAEDYCD
jgi:hypothetical protein